MNCKLCQLVFDKSSSKFVQAVGVSSRYTGRACILFIRGLIYLYPWFDAFVLCIFQCTTLFLHTTMQMLVLSNVA